MPHGVAADATTDMPAPVGNRPAQDARQVDAPNEGSGDWRGGDDATDFLGLDLEIAPSATPAADSMVESAAAPAATDGVLDDQASSSWLLSLDDASAGQAGLEPVAPDLPETTDAESGDEDSQDAPAVAPTDAPWNKTEAPRRTRGKRAVLMLSAAALAALALGAYQWNQKRHALLDDSILVNAPRSTKTPKNVHSKNDADIAANTTHAGGTPSTIASNDAHATPTSTLDSAEHTPSTTSSDANPIADSSAHADQSAVVRAGDSSLLADARPTDERLGDARSHETRLAGERIDSWLRSRESAALPGAEAIGSTAPFATSALTKSTVPGADSDHSPNFGMSRSPLSDPGAPSAGVDRSSQPMLKLRSSDKSGATKGGLRRATADDLAGIWEGSVIPMDSIASPSRLLTPGVGRVRVVIQRGEIFEGALYAVGQGRIWLDTDVGRLALLSEQVERIEHMSGRVHAPGLGAPGSQELAGLPRVRVHNPGGTFYGKVIARDESTVTLITDEGARVMLESRDVEAAPLGVRSVVVKSAAKR